MLLSASLHVPSLWFFKVWDLFEGSRHQQQDQHQKQATFIAFLFVLNPFVSNETITQNEPASHNELVLAVFYSCTVETKR